MELDGDHFDNDLDDDDDDSQETVRMTMTMLNNHSFYKKKNSTITSSKVAPAGKLMKISA